MMKTCISALSHGASPPKPVVVNISTVNWSASRNVWGRPSKVAIVHW